MLHLYTGHPRRRIPKWSPDPDRVLRYSDLTSPAASVGVAAAAVLGKFILVLCVHDLYYFLRADNFAGGVRYSVCVVLCCASAQNMFCRINTQFCDNSNVIFWIMFLKTPTVSSILYCNTTSSVVEHFCFSGVHVAAATSRISSYTTLCPASLPSAIHDFSCRLYTL